MLAHACCVTSNRQKYQPQAAEFDKLACDSVARSHWPEQQSCHLLLAGDRRPGPAAMTSSCVNSFTASSLAPHTYTSLHRTLVFRCLHAARRPAYDRRSTNHRSAVHSDSGVRAAECSRWMQLMVSPNVLLSSLYSLSLGSVADMRDRSLPSKPAPAQLVSMAAHV